MALRSSQLPRPHALPMVGIMITQIQVRRHGVIEYWGDVGGVVLAACSAILNSITATPCF